MFVMLCYFNAFGDKKTFLFLYLQIFSELFLIAADNAICHQKQTSIHQRIWIVFFKISAAIAANYHINLILSTYHNGRYSFRIVTICRYCRKNKENIQNITKKACIFPPFFVYLRTNN